MARKSQLHIPNTASWKVSELHIPNMARKSQLHIPDTVSWEVSELHIPNMARKSQLHIPNTVSWEVSELHIVHFDCYLHGFVKPWERLQELIPMSPWSQRPRWDGPERLISMFRCSHKVSVHRSCKANPHGRSSVHRSLACAWLVLADPGATPLGARGNCTFGPKCCK